MNDPTVVITPRRPALVSGFDNTVDLLVRLQAPAAPAAGKGAFAPQPGNRAGPVRIDARPAGRGSEALRRHDR